MLEILVPLIDTNHTPGNLPPEFLKIKALSQGQKQELCGLLLNTGEIIEVPNTHPQPVNNFRVSAEALTNYDRASISAIWHTHWSNEHPGEFTPGDLDLAHKRDRLPILLYHSAFDNWDYYEPQNPDPYPLRAGLRQKQYKVDDPRFYEDWPFLWGRMDCFALIRRFCLGVLGRDIGEWVRPDLEDFPAPGWSCPWDRQGAGLVEVDDRLKQYDLIEIAIGGGREPNHLAIAVDAGSAPQILHNPGYRCVSTIEPYGRHWQSRTVRRLRFNAAAAIKTGCQTELDS